MSDNDDFELKRALDALPRTIEPPAGAWAGIRAKIGAAPAGAAVARPHGDRFFRWPEHFEARTIRIAAGLGIIGIGLTVLSLTTRANARWLVSARYGAPAVDGRTLRASERFAVGGELRTDAISEARLRVGSIGSVNVEPNTRVRLLAAGAAEHRLAVDRGFIHARIEAPPRLFIVETPAGTAVDMGCEYTLHVDSLGNSVLHVQLGWVEFGGGARQSLVPAGFMVMSRAGGGVGIPVREFASNQVRWATTTIEQAGDGARADSAVLVLAAYAGRFDAVTLWHALPRVSGTNRAALYDALVRHAPPPEGVTREGVLAGDRLMMRLWWEALPGTLPITPDFVKRLWLLWLKAASWL